MRYIVISVGCLECLSFGEEIGEIVLKTDDIAEATVCAKEDPFPGQEARILLDTVTGTLLKFA